jgi:hypothetical protein
VAHGFLRAPDGKITTFDAPGAGTTADSAQGTHVDDYASFGTSGLNPAGAITGLVITSSGLGRGFLRAPQGRVTTFDALGEANGTFPGNINPEGAITGYYLDANFLNHGFLRDPDGRFTTIDVPGAGTGAYQGTIPAGINPSGAITGFWVGANNVWHGFLRPAMP